MVNIIKHNSNVRVNSYFEFCNHKQTRGKKFFTDALSKHKAKTKFHYCFISVFVNGLLLNVTFKNLIPYIKPYLKKLICCVQNQFYESFFISLP